MREEEIKYHNRLILLYKLGIEIPKFYENIYSVMFEAFDIHKEVIVNIEEAYDTVIPVTCYVKEDDVICCCTRKNKQYPSMTLLRIEPNTALKIDANYWKKTTASIYKKNKTYGVSSNDLMEILELVLKYKKIKFDFITTTKRETFKEINDEYLKSQNIKISKPRPLGQVFEIFKIRFKSLTCKTLKFLTRGNN